jgi:hypothetical protein
MPETHYVPIAPHHIDPSPCPNCSAKMNFARISPDNKRGFEILTFECWKCWHMESVVIKLQQVRQFGEVHRQSPYLSLPKM